MWSSRAERSGVEIYASSGADLIRVLREREISPFQSTASSRNDKKPSLRTLYG
ncbi:MAG: hypothetical protein PWQ09_1703 [Candidatus Cloacimonadota bacterium]|nr:hypothetical protein [Candidatus Cloacimonadota bacterium]